MREQTNANEMGPLIPFKRQTGILGGEDGSETREVSQGYVKFSKEVTQIMSPNKYPTSPLLKKMDIFSKIQSKYYIQISLSSLKPNKICKS